MLVFLRAVVQKANDTIVFHTGTGKLRQYIQCEMLLQPDNNHGVMYTVLYQQFH